MAQRRKLTGGPRCAGTDTLDSPPITKETLEIGCNYGAEGIQNFLKGEARKMAKELCIPIEEAEDCINDLLEMESERHGGKSDSCLPGHGEVVGQRYETSAASRA